MRRKATRVTVVLQEKKGKTEPQEQKASKVKRERRDPWGRVERQDFQA